MRAVYLAVIASAVLTCTMIVAWFVYGYDWAIMLPVAYGWGWLVYWTSLLVWLIAAIALIRGRQCRVALATAVPIVVSLFPTIALLIACASGDCI